MEHTTDRTRMAVAAGGVGVLAIAGLLVHGAGAHASSSVLLPCPFRELTGLPCPLCGATRSVGLLAQGSPDFLRYNPVWALLLVVGIAVLAATAVSPTIRAAAGGVARHARARGSTVAALAVLVVTVAWAVALVNRAAIVG